MSFLKTLFWIVLTVVVVLFSINNWLPVDVKLWGGITWSTKMPVPLFLFFLFGFVPTITYYRTKAWRLGRRLDTVSRELADERGMKRFRAPDRAKAGDDGELSLDRSAPDGTRS